ncbi:MAG: ATP-binding protein [Bacteroidetes bacterium]|jgi:uncharacterized protein|nr:ATP-binding protein [Bacteroidota bacterium]
MERTIQNSLKTWAQKKHKNPLIIMGARQVGKTYIMKWLGNEAFSKTAYFNFDERPELHEVFTTNKDVSRILEILSLISGYQIDSKTLVIFDEIQECAEALNSLKYFAENRPDLSVISSGSLLGLMLHPGKSFPVGKINFLNLHPMSFMEVLPYWSPESARFLISAKPTGTIPDFIFTNLKEQFKKYLVTGGMPAVINVFNETQSFEQCDIELSNLILAYRGDFSKHPVMSDIAKIGRVFDSLPSQLSRENKKFIYQLVRTGARAREYEDAIEWLINSGLIHKVRQSTKPGLPLNAYENLDAFKLYAFDVGILRKLSKLNTIAFLEGNRLFTEFKGAIIENYILQSLINQYTDIPYYWSSGNEAEVDFLIQHEEKIIPIEVKSELNIRSRSLALYKEKFTPELRIRYSLRNLSYKDGLLNIPHFLADRTRDWVSEYF